MIPVVILVRHEKWMDERDRVYSDEAISEHPDMR